MPLLPIKKLLSVPMENITNNVSSNRTIDWTFIDSNLLLDYWRIRQRTLLTHQATTLTMAVESVKGAELGYFLIPTVTTPVPNGSLTSLLASSLTMR